MKHIDLFSGIGGFSLAFDNVFHEQKNNHTFVEIDPFCQAVLKKHWPEAEIVGDIRTFANAKGTQPKNGTDTSKNISGTKSGIFILTGGFPCQPFSQAGRRKGTEDDRHLWPEMLRVIQATRPEWVIAENVRGLLTIGGGMVFEQVCADLESAGYEVQPIIIPAVAVNAPHRRDRVWFIAHCQDKRSGGIASEERRARKRKLEQEECQRGALRREDKGCASKCDATDPDNRRIRRHKRASNETPPAPRYSWKCNWLEVATRLCGMDDGIPKRMDRNPRLKALGNAIVPQVAEEIMKAIKQILLL